MSLPHYRVYFFFLLLLRIQDLINNLNYWFPSSREKKWKAFFHSTDVFCGGRDWRNDGMSVPAEQERQQTALWNKPYNKWKEKNKREDFQALTNIFVLEESNKEINGKLEEWNKLVLEPFLILTLKRLFKRALIFFMENPKSSILNRIFIWYDYGIFF